MNGGINFSKNCVKDGALGIEQDLMAIYRAGVERVDSYQMLIEHVQKLDQNLEIQFEGQNLKLDLRNYEKIYVVGVGKASARMGRAMENILGERLTGGIVSTKYGHCEPLKKIKIIEAGHPLPDENSLLSGEEINALARTFDDKTLVINLISGGGSALLEIPSSFEDNGKSVQLSLEDLRQTTQVLLACGATINEINCIRKHLSAIKGGQLVRMIQPAHSINLILSDVVGDRLDAIASGLTVGDETTFADGLEVIERYGIRSKLPEVVYKALQLGADRVIRETPKPGDAIFNTTVNLLIGTNSTAVQAASNKARQLGYRTMLLPSPVVGEARQAATMLFKTAKDLRQQQENAAETSTCILAGGETTVTLRGYGKGGRNQEMALSFLCEMEKEQDDCEGIYFLAASTDGSDGPTDAAGAFASPELIQKANELKLDPVSFLRNNDSYHFFEKVGGLFKTGPTKTNVCDIQILIIR